MIIKLNKCSFVTVDPSDTSIMLCIAIEQEIIKDYPTSNPFTPAYMLMAFV